ncbi:hypothetical protein [uncultured Gordonia sp.]|uniref:hypothetical protein n=2 Tax=unclassified Gordonia (in: high G+C Gram-positive bacteria) TaxID=2657482 RepID=UPI002625D323|nr:hypothetical protein [uncultured Gordonia sp.]HNP58819.1 hypothetical protein [Gordonia sp. (in: high G+C Gram-positive bacteria)]
MSVPSVDLDDGDEVDHEPMLARLRAIVKRGDGAAIPGLVPEIRAACDLGLTRDAEEKHWLAVMGQGGERAVRVLAVALATLDERAEPVGDANDPYHPWLERQGFCTPLLQDVRARARGGLVPPWAALGMLLAATASVIPPRVQLPAIVGGRASLNSITGIVGASGAGKGAAAAVLSPRFVPLGADGQPGLGLNWKRPPVRQAVGSGEAISALYVHSEKVAGPDGGPPETKMVQHETTAWPDWPEVDKLVAVRGRQASTMDAELRQFWSGEGLGSVTKTASLHVEAHKYRGVATISIQPGRAAALFSDEAGGLLQRLLLFAGDRDPHATGNEPRVDGDLEITVPYLPPGDDVVEFLVDPVVETIIRERRIARTSGALTVDPLDAHGDLLRLKIAATGAWMHGTLTVDYHTWRWAGSVMEHHRRTRAWLQSQIAATVRAAAESAGATDGVRRAVAREVEEAEADQRFSGQWATALDGTANWAQGRGPFTRRDASRAGRSGSLRATRAGDLLTDLTVQGRLRVVQVDANGHAAAWEAVS